MDEDPQDRTIELQIAVLVVVVTAFCVAGVVFLLLYDLPDGLIYRIRKFETIIGALLATMVAVWTAASVYIISKLPIRAEERRERRKRINRQVIGNALIYAEITTLLLKLRFLLNDIEKAENEALTFDPIKIPERLRDLELLDTQPENQVSTVAHLLGRIELINSMWSRDAPHSGEYDDDLKESLTRAVDRAEKLRDILVTAIPEIPSIHG
ncbi:hypothetical protein EOI86_12150 [Hwanghaeella grinnelliae]|uniref:Uncharacterized protein n=1 Tax=Hwanghaeella grinnelliae TaxID=2500179 RepID=A0A3S3UNB4_9PROT|nr:hypothetical protein [Hwanghaeella grinnelliae]RVU35994.1 hypothetical protein EOI86_12150 [Hwanghaeella grinnelliae]